MFKFIAKIRNTLNRWAEAQERKRQENEAKRKEYEAQIQNALAMRLAQSGMVNNGESWRHNKEEWARIASQPFNPAEWKERKRLKKQQKQREWEERATAHYEKTGKVLRKSSGGQYEETDYVSDPVYSEFEQNLWHKHFE